MTAPAYAIICAGCLAVELDPGAGRLCAGCVAAAPAPAPEAPAVLPPPNLAPTSATPVETPARVRDEPCPKCGRMSGPEHWAVCDVAPCPRCGRLATPDHRRACVAVRRPEPPAAPSDLEPPGDWCLDELGGIVQPDGSPWEGEDDPPGIDVRALEIRPRPEPPRPQDAPARVGPPRGPSRPPTRRRGALPWVPLAPPPPDTPWRVTRDVALRTLSPNRLMAEHFRSRTSRRRAERAAMREAFQGAPLEGHGWIVTFVRVAGALVDDDSLPACFKSCRDALADALTGGDDSHRAPVQWVYRQHVERVKEPHRILPRSARASDPRLGLPFRPARPGRLTFRYRSWVRVTIESAVEHAAGGVSAQCEPGSLADALRVRLGCPGRHGETACGASEGA